MFFIFLGYFYEYYKNFECKRTRKKRNFEFLWELIIDWKSLWNYYSYRDNPEYVIFVFDKNIWIKWTNEEITINLSNLNLFNKAIALKNQYKADIPDSFKCEWYTKEELKKRAFVVSKRWLEEDIEKGWIIIPKQENIFDDLIELHKIWINEALNLHNTWIKTTLELYNLWVNYFTQLICSLINLTQIK